MQSSPQPREQLRARAWYRATLATDHEAVAIETNLEAVAETNERVARQALTPLDALEQETRRKARQLHKRRDRRVEITRNIEWRFQRSLQYRQTQYGKKHAGKKKPIPGVIPEMGSLQAVRFV